MRSNYRPIGKYIRLVDERNKGLNVQQLLGLSISKQFIPSVANIIGTDMENYKIIKRNQFACSTMQVRRDKKMPVALLQEVDEAIISQAYPVFEVKDEKLLLPEYLMMWFTRAEFDREACFNAVGGVRGSLEWKDFTDMQLPIPSITKQREIVKEYNVIKNRISLNQQLIQKLEETAQAIYKQWFIDEIDEENLPDGWRFGQLVEVSESIVAGVIPQYTEEGDDFVLGQRCVHDNIVDLKFARTHSPKDNSRLVEYGDILINSTGSGTLGRVGQVYYKPIKLSFDSNMTRVRPLADYYIDYLGCFLSQKEEYFVHISQGSTNQTRLYCSMVSPVKILIPEKNMLIDFKNKVRNIRTQQQNVRHENTLLDSMKDLLLSKLATIEN